MPEQKSVQAMKSPQAILCVLPRALKQHGRFSARQNRVCPCQLMVDKLMYLHLGKGKIVSTEDIVGIFDLDIQSHLTRKYLTMAERPVRS